MLLEFILTMGEWSLEFLANLFPKYIDYPFPDWFIPNLNLFISKWLVFIELPIIRIFHDYIWNWVLPWFLAIFIIRTIIKYIAIIPGFGNVRNIKD